jgi:hypothetical protein
MIKRTKIRDNRSDKKIKPRILDVITEDDGTQLIEVKDGGITRTMLLADFEQQVAAINK